MEKETLLHFAHNKSIEQVLRFNKTDTSKLLSHPLWIAGTLFSVWISLHFATQVFFDDKFAAQLVLSRVFLLVLAGILFSLTIRNSSKWVSEKVSAYSVAIFRIVFYGFVSVGFTAPLYLFNIVSVDFPWAEIPVSQRVPLPFMEWYMMHVPVSPIAVYVAVKLIAVSAFACMIGLGVRWFSVIFLLATFYLNGFQNFFGKVNHNHFIVWFAFLFCFAQSCSVLSVEAWIRKKRGVENASENDGLLIKFVAVLIGIIYFFPGFHKIWASGLDWAFTDNLRNQLYWKWYELNGWQPFFKIDRFPLLCKLAGFFTLVFETCFLFFVFDKRTKPLAIAAGILFHLFTYLFMQINFLYLLLCYVALIDWRWIGSKLQQEILPKHRIRNTSLMYAGFFLIGVNGIAGIFKINSYPVACFPTFENLVSDTTETLVYKTSSALELNRRKMLDKYTPYIFRQWEIALLQKLSAKDRETAFSGAVILSQRVAQAFPELNQADTLKIYTRKLQLTASGFVPLQADSLVYLQPLKLLHEP